MKNKILTLTCILSFNLSFAQYEQYIQYVEPYLNDSIRSGFFYFTTPNNFQAGQLYQLYRINAPDLNNNMILIDEHVDSLMGFTHMKYQQTFMNIPIEGAGCIEHYDTEGSLSFINAKVADSIHETHIPMLNRSEAIYSLISNLERDKRIVFAWDDGDWEKEIQLNMDDSTATWYPTAELIWAVDTLKDMHLIIPGSRYTLAYKISITIIEPEFETFIYYVDAHTGNILKVNSTRIYDGPADIYGYGSQTIDTQWKGGFTQKYILQTNDDTRVIHTKKNPNGNTAWWLLDNTTDTDDDWGDTYLTETSTHYNVSQAWDYFRTTFARVGQDAQSIEARVRTQLSEANAYFEPGNDNHNNLTFGKDNGWDWGMDPSIAAHEFAHGVTHHSSNLEYESGAINESFSDIFGVVIHAVMYDAGTTDWTIGNFIPNAPTRSLANPNLWNQPDTYLGNLWYTGSSDNGGVHINSGVMNKWFYILAQGENGWNDNANYYDVDGIGMSKAAKITYAANVAILMNSSQYTDVREATIQVAKIIYGECSVEYQMTIDAWYAVGIGNENSCSFTLDADNVQNDDLLIYPNPASDELNIELPYITTEKIRIFDFSGKMVREFSNELRIFETDISMLSSGIYTIQFSFNGNIITEKFVVQK